MKKIVIVCLMVLVLMQSAYALTTDIKDNYLPGQTVITKIYGNVLEPILAENVILKRANVEVPIDYAIQNINGSYYLWFIAPRAENNYTLFIKNVLTTVSGVEEKIDFQTNFSVKGNLSSYSIKPGFISTEKDFEISVTLNKDAAITINTTFPSQREILINPGQNKIQFSIVNITKRGWTNLSLGSYFIPVFITEKAPINKIDEVYFTRLVEYYNLTNVTVSNYSNPEVVQQVTDLCYELNGIVCSTGQKCYTNNTKVIAGKTCCLDGFCKTVTTQASNAWIGYLIAGVLIIGGIYVWLRYYKTGKIKNPLQKRVEEIERK